MIYLANVFTGFKEQLIYWINLHMFHLISWELCFPLKYFSIIIIINVNILKYKLSDFQLTEQFETFVHLMTLYMFNTKLVDYTVTDINKRKVKDLMVTMEKQLEKAVHVCLTSKSKV